MFRRNVLLLSVVVLALATWLSAQPYGIGERRQGGEGMLGRTEMLKEKIGLSDDQIEQLAESRRETEKKIIPLRSELELLRLDLEEILSSDSFSESKANSVINKIVNKQSEMHKIRLQAMLDKRNILTKEQWNALGDLKEQRKQMRRKGRGFRQGRHGRFGPGSDGGAEDSE